MRFDDQKIYDIVNAFLHPMQVGGLIALHSMSGFLVSYLIWTNKIALPIFLRQGTFVSIIYCFMNAEVRMRATRDRPHGGMLECYEKPCNVYRSLFSQFENATLVFSTFYSEEISALRLLEKRLLPIDANNPPFQYLPEIMGEFESFPFPILLSHNFQVQNAVRHAYSRTLARRQPTGHSSMSNRSNRLNRNKNTITATITSHQMSGRRNRRLSEPVDLMEIVPEDRRSQDGGGVRCDAV